MKPIIILDRDGVINYDSDEYIKSPAEWQPIPGSLAAIARLTKAGYRIAVTTNQSGVALGLYDEITLQAIHEKMQHAVVAMAGNIEVIFYCPHQTSDNCDCRKPKPGMLLKVGEYFKVPVDDIYYIGDKLSDIQAAQAVNCRPILVRTGYGKQTLAANPSLDVDVYDDLAAAVDSILQ